MPGFMDFINNYISRRVQKIFLLTVAALTGIIFISFWPHELYILKQVFPRDVSLRWFMSFPSQIVR